MPDESGYLFVNDGNSWPMASLGPGLEISAGLIRLRQTGTAWATAGALLAGPFQVSDRPTAWFRVQASLRGGAASLVNSHIQFYTLVVPSGPAPWDPASSAPFSDPGWKAAARDALNFAVRNNPGLIFYLGAVFRGDGTQSPLLEQVRIEYGRDTWAKFLPPAYRQQPAPADFLERFLAIPQTVLDGIEQQIEDLPLLFDPGAASAGEPPSWLGWLSGWLTFALDEHWPEADARAHLAGAFRLSLKRGTLEGLREYLRIYAGVNAIIEEPAREAAVWPLGDSNPLGFSTMLAPGPLQGAVLGTSATVDQSHLTSGEDFGSALFEDLAHHFCVCVYCAELTAPGALDRVRATLDREKPAHTTYELCVIEPAMRAGVQARVGIDTIVAAGPAAAQTDLPLGAGVLAAHSDPCGQTGGPHLHSTPDDTGKPEGKEDKPWQLQP